MTLAVLIGAGVVLFAIGAGCAWAIIAPDKNIDDA
jgi:hypothetical protein